MWNYFKVEPKQTFLLFFWIWAILNFNQTWLKINSLTLSKTYFQFENAFIPNFFNEWNASALRLRGPDRARTPILCKNSVWKRFQIQSMFCKKSRNLSWVRSGWSSKWLIFKRSRQVCFGSTLKQFHMWYGNNFLCSIFLQAQIKVSLSYPKFWLFKLESNLNKLNLEFWRLFWWFLAGRRADRRAALKKTVIFSTCKKIFEGGYSINWL